MSDGDGIAIGVSIGCNGENGADVFMAGEVPGGFVATCVPAAVTKRLRHYSANNLAGNFASKGCVIWKGA